MHWRVILVCAVLAGGMAAASPSSQQLTLMATEFAAGSGDSGRFSRRNGWSQSDS